MFALILFFPFLSHGAIFGIDFGCEYIKVGMVQPGRGVHVALNQQSKRLSPSYFAFWNKTNPKLVLNPDHHWTLDDIEDCNWAFLDAAKSHSLRFPHNQVKGISPILDNINGLKRREVMALVLRHLISTVDDGRWSPETAQIVLTVEPKLSRSDRYAIAEAVRLSNATLASIMDSPTAAAQVYALEKRSLYLEQSKLIMFIDYGATYTWVAIFEFEDIDDQPIVHELCIVTNSSLGGNLMDRELANLLMQKFAESNKVDIPTNERVVSRFIEEARRAKEILTVNKDVDIRLEDIVDDYGLTYHLTREVFQELISDCNQSLRELFNEAIAEAGINATDLDSIELIGGITRVPYVQEVLKEISGMEKLNRTMNSEETVALGAGYKGASNSGAFIVKKVFLAPFVNTNISILHNGKKIQIFEPKSTLNETYVYQFKASENDQITIYENDVNLTSVFIDLPENTTDDTDINVTFGFDELTLPTVVSCTLNTTVTITVNEKVNITKDDDDDNDDDDDSNDVNEATNETTNETAKVLTEEVNKTVNKKINNIRNVFFTNPENGLTQEEFWNSTIFIHRMDEVLAERKKFAKIKNDYEGYIYRIKDYLEYNNTYKKVVNETQRENLTNIANEHEQWLFGPHDDAPLNYSTIQRKYDELHDQIHPAETRAEEYIKRAPAFMKLNNSIMYVFNQINNTWPEKKPWLTAEQLDSVWGQYNRTKEWFTEKYALQKNQSDFEDPVVRVSEIDTQRMLLEWNFNSTNKIKKPTPTPAPKAAEPAGGNQQFININGQNVSIVNGSITGSFVNGTWVPTGGDVNATDVNGTDVNATQADGDNENDGQQEQEGQQEGETANGDENESESTTSSSSSEEETGDDIKDKEIEKQQKNKVDEEDDGAKEAKQEL